MISIKNQIQESFQILKNKTRPKKGEGEENMAGMSE